MRRKLQRNGVVGSQHRGRASQGKDRKGVAPVRLEGWKEVYQNLLYWKQVYWVAASSSSVETYSNDDVESVMPTIFYTMRTYNVTWNIHNKMEEAEGDEKAGVRESDRQLYRSGWVEGRLRWPVVVVLVVGKGEDNKKLCLTGGGDDNNDGKFRSGDGRRKIAAVDIQDNRNIRYGYTWKWRRQE